MPQGWPAAAPDASFGIHAPIFRRASGNTRVTIFEGGHEIVHQAALNWLAKQRKGQPVGRADQFERPRLRVAGQLQRALAQRADQQVDQSVVQAHGAVL